MTVVSAPASPFALLTANSGEELASTALALAAQAGDDQRLGSLVIVVHPEADEHRVLSTSGVGVLRAAVSVAVESGNNRLWADAPADDTIEHSLRSLPEVIRAAAEAAQVVATHTGAVRVADQLVAVAIWFEFEAGVAPLAQRRTTLDRLATAAKRDAERAAQAAEAAEAASSASTPVQATSPIAEVAEGRRKRFELAEDDLDPLTRLAHRRRFEVELENYEADQAALVVIGIDDLDQVADDDLDHVVKQTADRVVADLRKSDLVARLDTGVFAVLLGNVDRSNALGVSKRLMNAIATDPPTRRDGNAVANTVALVHQHGLVDTEEMMESASAALQSAQHAGGARLVLGS